MNRKKDTISLVDFLGAFVSEKRMIGGFIIVFFIAAVTTVWLFGFSLKKETDRVIIPFVIEDAIEGQAKLEKSYVVEAVNSQLVKQFSGVFFYISQSTGKIELSLPYSQNVDEIFTGVLKELNTSPKATEKADSIFLSSPRLRTYQSFETILREKRSALRTALFELRNMYIGLHASGTNLESVEFDEVAKLKSLYLRWMTEIGMVIHEQQNNGKMTEAEILKLNTQLLDIERRATEAFIVLEDVYRTVNTYQVATNQNNFLLVKLFWDMLRFRPEKNDIHASIELASQNKTSNSLKLFISIQLAGVFLGLLTALVRRFILPAPSGVSFSNSKQHSH